MQRLRVAGVIADATGPLIAFLAGDDAAMITGSNYLIDGGRTVV